MREAEAPSHLPVCRICGGSCSSVGPVFHPVPTKVAGVEIDLTGIQFQILRCSSCGFQFKDPPIPPERLLDCYSRASRHHWDNGAVDPHRRYFDVMRDLLQKRTPGGRILDIGCFNGALLSFLNGDWQKFGIEPSVEAAATASERGVTILGQTLEDLRDHEASFDAVVATDVVEHVEDPLGFFRRIHSLLKVGGTCLIVTGDTSAPSWRMLGSRYWYCSLPEHISFFSVRTMRSIAEIVGFEPLDYRRLSHARSHLWAKATDYIKSIGYVASLKMKGFGSPTLYKVVSQRRGPTSMTTRDHMFFTMRRL